MKSCLAIEDMDSEGEVLRRLLPVMFSRVFQGNVRVDVVGTVKQAFEFIHDSPPDVVILDLVMPDSGLENSIENVIPALVSGPPIFVLTGYQQPEIRVRCFEKGCDEFMLKQAARRHHEEMCERVYGCYLRRQYRDGRKPA